MQINDQLILYLSNLCELIMTSIERETGQNQWKEITYQAGSEIRQLQLNTILSALNLLETGFGLEDPGQVGTTQSSLIPSNDVLLGVEQKE